MATSSTGLAGPGPLQCLAGVVERADALHLASPGIQIRRQLRCARVRRHPELIAVRAAQLRRPALVVERRIDRSAAHRSGEASCGWCPLRPRRPGNARSVFQAVVVSTCSPALLPSWMSSVSGIAIRHAFLAGDRDACEARLRARHCLVRIAGAELGALGEIGRGVVAIGARAAHRRPAARRGPVRRRPRLRPG